MGDKTIDVIGFGSPLLDLLIEVDDNFLEKINLEKGGMHLSSKEKIDEILNQLKDYKIIECAGGSCANTIAGIAYLGGKSMFCGVIGDDDNGRAYEISLSNENLISKFIRIQNNTGQVIALITPDFQRTMIVNLGAAIEFKKEYIIEEDIKNAKILHIEAYQLEGENSYDAILYSIDIAKKNNTKISIDLADSNLINRNKEIFKVIVEKYADIVFVNEMEAKEFTGCEDEEDALNYLSQFCEIAIVKIGSRGSLIKKDGIIYRIDAKKVIAIDTTGAGDNYAAGILYGITKNLDLQQAGEIASSHAAKIVMQIGARLI